MSPHCLFFEGVAPDLPASGVPERGKDPGHCNATGALLATKSDRNRVSQEFTRGFLIMELPSTKAGRNRQQLQKAAGLLKHGQPESAIRLLVPLPESLPQLNLLSQAQLLLIRQQVDAGKGETRQAERLRLECVQVLKRWSRASRTDPEPWLRMARLALLEGEFARAVKRCERASKLENRSVPAHYLKAIALQLSGKPGSEALLEAVVRSRYGRNLSEAEIRLETVIEQFDTAAGAHHQSFDPARLAPDSDLVTSLSSRLKTWLGRADASPSPRQVRRYADACYNLGVMELAAYDRAAAASDWFDRCLQIDPGHVQGLANSAYALNYHPGLEPSERLEKALHIGGHMTRQAGEARLLPPADPSPERPLRIGLLSSDLRRHSVGYFAVGVIEALAETRHDLHVYHSSHQHDAMTDRVQQAACRYLPVAALDNAALARQMLTDRLDILIDMNGYSRGHRALVLAERVAPVQISWLGYPATTGLSAMDFRIVDVTTDSPACVTGNESLLRLPRPFLCYEAPSEALGIDPSSRPLPGPQRPVTFGCFNHLPKLHRRLVLRWAEILEQVPESRLLLKNAGAPVPDSNRRILADFEQQGIDPDRIEILGRAPGVEEHLARYLEVDIALDTWPYNGTTTTCEALFMGTPVVGLAGDHHAARVGASLLSAVGLESLLAATEAGYVETAVQLAGQPDRLRKLHEGLRDTMKTSVLMDLGDFVAHYETALQSAWKHRCLQTTP